MRSDDQNYHREREQHCRAMADLASDPDIRRRHEELASLHAGLAVVPSNPPLASAETSLG